ncbi:MAG: hypothetical protein AB2556_24835, partial [Candidatus Thiodiazotropha sp.]
DGRGNADLRALPRGGGRGDRRYRGAAKGTRPTPHPHPLLCYLGAERATPQKKKDRLAALATAQAVYTTTIPPWMQNNTSPRHPTA